MAIAYCVLKECHMHDQPTNRQGYAAEYDATPIPDPAASAPALKVCIKVRDGTFPVAQSSPNCSTSGNQARPNPSLP